MAEKQKGPKMTVTLANDFGENYSYDYFESQIRTLEKDILETEDKLWNNERLWEILSYENQAIKKKKQQFSGQLTSINFRKKEQKTKYEEQIEGLKRENAVLLEKANGLKVEHNKIKTATKILATKRQKISEELTTTNLKLQDLEKRSDVQSDIFAHQETKILLQKAHVADLLFEAQKNKELIVNEAKRKAQLLISQAKEKAITLAQQTEQSKNDEIQEAERKLKEIQVLLDNCRKDIKNYQQKFNHLLD